MVACVVGGIPSSLNTLPMEQLQIKRDDSLMNLLSSVGWFFILFYMKNLRFQFLKAKLELFWLHP
jgi:hypothetical protein